MKSYVAILLTTITCQAFAAGLLPETPALIENGKSLYIKNCSTCHGEKGDGNGPAGKMMKTKPRNFKDAQFVNGDKPENVFKTINDGLPGTAMAAFKNLSDEEKSSITYYVLKLKSGN